MTEETKHHKNVTPSPGFGNERSILIGAIIISLSILLHGVIVSNFGSINNKTGTVDAKAVKELVKNIDTSHRYFSDENVSEKIVLVEYSDTECPFCKMFHSTIGGLVKSGNGNVAWVYKHFPLSIHPNAQKEAEAIECVREVSGKDLAIKYTDVIYAVTESNNKLPKEALFEISDAMGLKTKKIKECVDSGKYAELVKNQINEGIADGVNGTPHTIIYSNTNGQKTKVGEVSGAQPKEAFDAIINSIK